uniref:Uncharacterized protein n=1 Tax=Acrobeloides nanus TaxID=290746 RepID=A0A914E3T8_9BILA
MFSVWSLMNYYGVLPQIVGIVTSILIIVGDRSEKAWMYIPYLVLTACGILGSILLSIYLLVIAIVLPDYELEDYEDWPESGKFYTNFENRSQRKVGEGFTSMSGPLGFRSLFKNGIFLVKHS